MIAYKFLVWTVLLGGCLAGGWLAWRHVSKSMYLRDPTSDLFSDAPISPGLLRRRRLWRLLMTGAGAAVGTVVGMMALMTLTRFQT